MLPEPAGGVAVDPGGGGAGRCQMVELLVPDYSTDSHKKGEGTTGEMQDLLGGGGHHHTMGQEKGGCMERRQAGARRAEQRDQWRKEECGVGLRVEKKGYKKEEGWSG